MSIKEALQGKVNSLELWQKIKADNPHAFSNYKAVPGLGIASALAVPEALWWAFREETRIIQGVYEETEVTKWVNAKQPHLFLHVSTDDRQMVAYTPDRAAGERDSQIKSTLGKVLQRYFPLFADEYIQGLVAKHYSELSDEIEFLEGPEAIADAYTNGVGSCMGKDMTALSNGKHMKIHPAAAYGAPNIRLAVLRDANGKINARSLVRLNEKIYIRVYGDNLLKNRLIKQGYKLGGWLGETFHAIPVDYVTPKEPGHAYFAMPYLDSNGGAGNEVDCTLAYIDDKLQTVAPDIKRRLEMHQPGSTKSGVTTACHTNMVPVYTANFVGPDYFNPEVILNSMTEQCTAVYVNGQRYLTKMSAHDAPANFKCLLEGGKYIMADENSIFSYNGSSYLDTDANRKNYGHVQIDPVLYPEYSGVNRGWVLKADMLLVPVPSNDEENPRRDAWVKKSECLNVVVAQPYGGCTAEYVFRPTDEFKATLTKIHSPTRGLDCFTTVPKSELIKTPAGRTVLRGYHGIEEDAYGTWDFTRNQKKVKVQNLRVTLPKTTSLSDFILNGFNDYVRRRVDRIVDKTPGGLYGALIEAAGDVSSNLGYYIFPAHGDRPERSRSIYAYDFPWSNHQDMYGSTVPRSWVAEQCYRLMGYSNASVLGKEMARRFKIAEAEANAVEAPNRLDSPVVEAVEEDVVEDVDAKWPFPPNSIYPDLPPAPPPAPGILPPPTEHALAAVPDNGYHF
jgi:hypothetical protein